jgi:Methyltransferase domain
MTSDDARLYVLSLYKNLQKRDPASAEFEHWVKFVQDGNPAEKLFYAFVNSEEYSIKTRVSSLFPAGHYYSAIVDPSTVAEYVEKERQTSPAEISGISVPLDEMERFWRRSSAIISCTPFQDGRTDEQRFYYDNNIFPYGDAISLRAMIADLRPRTIIEIGSGFSSACMLDCADEFKLDTAFTFIDPYPERLNGLLRPGDHSRISVIDTPIQKVDVSLFDSLGRGDILFIDSTHILKTGSDVHYELFHILPGLHRGAVIHFHDVQFPFEYPDQWIFENNHSWNEIYALRAFLMYSSDFRIRFWGSCLAQKRSSIIREVFPLFLRNPGGSLWMERT